MPFQLFGPKPGECFLRRERFLKSGKGKRYLWRGLVAFLPKIRELA